MNIKEIIKKNPQVDAQDLERIHRRLEQARKAGFRLRAPFRITREKRAFVDDEAMMRARSVKLTALKRGRTW